MPKEKHALLQYFEFNHLPGNLREISQSFAALAYEMDAALEDGSEKSACLRKLLEAKDCAVRSAAYRR